MTDNLWRTWEELTDSQQWTIANSANPPSAALAYRSLWRWHEETAQWECADRSKVKASEIQALPTALPGLRMVATPGVGRIERTGQAPL